MVDLLKRPFLIWKSNIKNADKKSDDNFDCWGSGDGGWEIRSVGSWKLDTWCARSAASEFIASTLRHWLLPRPASAVVPGHALPAPPLNTAANTSAR
jgi:hypothetical protein